MKRVFWLPLLCCFLFNFAPAKAGVIELPPNAGGHLISAHSPIGQTFVAEDVLVVLGLYIQESDVYASPDRSLVMNVYSGQGISGTLLYTRTLVPDAGFRGYLDVDLRQISMVVGTPYSITLSANSLSPRWVSMSSIVPYASGVAVIQGTLWPTLPDKAFHVVPISAAASASPEPATYALLFPIAIILALPFARRKSSRMF